VTLVQGLLLEVRLQLAAPTFAATERIAERNRVALRAWSSLDGDVHRSPLWVDHELDAVIRLDALLHRVLDLPYGGLAVAFRRRAAARAARSRRPSLSAGARGSGGATRRCATAQRALPAAPGATAHARRTPAAHRGFAALRGRPAITPGGATRRRWC